MAGERVLPSGQVTLVFTDIEGSTRLLGEAGEQYGELLAAHHRLLRGVWERHGGVEVDTEGDAFFVAFSLASSAVAAVTDAQLTLAAAGDELRGARVRIGVHTGEPRVRDGGYWGADVHYAARLCAAANGGQVLLSATTRTLVPESEVEDLGEHALKDFPAARRIFHLLVDGRGAGAFAPVRTLGGVVCRLVASMRGAVISAPKRDGGQHQREEHPEHAGDQVGGDGALQRGDREHVDH